MYSSIYSALPQLIEEAGKDSLMDEVLEFLNDICNFISTSNGPVSTPAEPVENDRVLQVIQAVVQWAHSNSTLHEVSHK